MPVPDVPALGVPDVLLIRGCPRTGTTLVAELVNASDRAAIIFEYALGQLVHDLQPILDYGRSHRSLTDKAALAAAAGEAGGDTYHNPPRREAVSRFPTPERLGAIVAGVVAATLGKRDVALIGSKTPGAVALRDHDILAPLFSTIKFLFVVRSPLPTINSMMNRRNRARLGLDDWPFPDVASAIGEYRQNVRLLLSHVARHPGRCLVVKYEDLIDRFAATAGVIDAFLGPGFDLARDSAKLFQVGVRLPAATKDVLTPAEQAAVRTAFGTAIDGWERKVLTGLHPGSVDALADCADALVPGTRYRYDDTLGERRCLGVGWSVLQPDGVWTDSERADLFFTVPDDGAYVVSLGASVFLPGPQAALSLRIAVNGADAVRARWGTGDAPAGPGPHLLACGPIQFTAGTVQQLTVHVDPVRSPLECGLSNDDRRLGLLLHELALTRA